MGCRHAGPVVLDGRCDRHKSDRWCCRSRLRGALEAGCPLRLWLGHERFVLPRLPTSRDVPQRDRAREGSRSAHTKPHDGEDEGPLSVGEMNPVHAGMPCHLSSFLVPPLSKYQQLIRFVKCARETAQMCKGSFGEV